MKMQGPLGGYRAEGKQVKCKRNDSKMVDSDKENNVQLKK